LPEKLRLYVTVGREMEPSGSYEDVEKHVDICHKHAIEIIRRLMKDENNPRLCDHDKSRALCDLVRKWKPRT
jgi:hypothetical protein